MFRQNFVFICTPFIKILFGFGLALTKHSPGRQDEDLDRLTLVQSCHSLQVGGGNERCCEIDRKKAEKKFRLSIR